MFRTSTSTFTALCVAVALLALAACTTGPAIRSQTDPSADVSRYRTFGFYESAASSQQNYASFLSQYIQNAISEQMKSRGYVAADNPDLLINFHLQTADKISVSQTPSTYYGWRRGYGWAGGGYDTEVSSYTQGTLNIDVVDRAQNRLLWEGIAVGKIGKKAVDNPQPAVQAVVAQIYERYPGRAAGM